MEIFQALILRLDMYDDLESFWTNVCVRALDMMSINLFSNLVCCVLMDVVGDIPLGGILDMGESRLIRLVSTWQPR